MDCEVQFPLGIMKQMIQINCETNQGVKHHLVIPVGHFSAGFLVETLMEGGFEGWFIPPTTHSKVGELKYIFSHSF